MDNTEQLKFEAMGNLDILISKRKLLRDNKRLDALGDLPRSSRDFDKT